MKLYPWDYPTHLKELRGIFQPTPKPQIFHSKKRYNLVIGKFNAVVGSKSDGNEDVMGKFGHGTKNRRGGCLLKYCRYNKLVVANTLFKDRKRQKVTRRSPDGTTKNCIDYVLVPKRWKTSTLDKVTLPGGDFDSDHALVMASFHLCLKSTTKFQKKLPRFRTKLLKEESTCNRYRINLDLALKNFLENSSMNPEEIDLDALVNKSTETFIHIAETVFGRTNVSEKPQITDMIIQLRKDKRDVTNRQDPESREHLKRLTEKKITCALTTYIHDKCNQCELDFRKGYTHYMYKRIRELSRRKTTLTNVLLNKDRTRIKDTTGIRERKQHFHEKLNPPNQF